MVYASSKVPFSRLALPSAQHQTRHRAQDALRKSLVGIASEIQGTDLSEVAYDTGALELITLDRSELIIPLSRLQSWNE